MPDPNDFSGNFVSFVGIRVLLFDYRGAIKIQIEIEIGFEVNFDIEKAGYPSIPIKQNRLRWRYG